MPVWSYKEKAFAVKQDSTVERTRCILDGMLYYAVTVSGQTSGFIVGAVSIPGPNVYETIQGFDPASLWIIQSTPQISLKVDCGQFNDRVQVALLKQIEANGWIHHPFASTVLEASMGIGKQQTVTYNMMSGGSKFDLDSRTPAGAQTASFTPQLSSLVM